MSHARIPIRLLLLAVLGGLPAPDAAAQQPLTLADAMARARSMTAGARAVEAAVDEAAARTRQARAGYFPRVDVSESVQRGNHPVFVFSSLLAQQRFTEANFAIDALNRPSPITNTRTAITADQPIFDRSTTLAVRSAELGRQIAEAGRAGTGQDLALAAAQAFVRVLQFEAEQRAATAAVAAATDDVQRARDRREAGLVTEADVLAADVRLAAMRQRQIGADAELAVARLELSDAIGAPLGETHALVRPGAPAPTGTADALVGEAQVLRADRRGADLQVQLAANARDAARAAFLPRVSAQGGWEFNGNDLADQRSSWVVGAQIQLNVFRGLGDVARAAEARHAERRASAERERLDRRIEVEVRAAAARVESARAREAAGRAALAQARESQRIIRDRYDGGLATITDVLRAAEAALDAESQATAAEMDVILSAVALDRAAGRL